MSPRACIVGGGVIGGGWAARFLLNGWDVAVFDPDPEAGRKIAEVLANARRALPGLYDRALPAEGTLSFHDDLAAAVAGADWIQESVPERLDVKHRVLGELTRLAAPEAVIGSSTSGFRPSELTAQGARAIVAHPFNPVYLLPLVELVGEAGACARAAGILRGLGMYPLTLRKEIDAHIADRLLEAVWRESLWLVRDGVATTAEIDEAIRMGFGLRWAQMGLFETYRIAGGEAGMEHFLAQFGPALAWPWSRLTDVPEFTDELVALIAGQSDAQSGHLPIRALERLRDDNLVGILRALKATGSGAGGTILAHEAGLPAPAPAPAGDLPVTCRRTVPASWTEAPDGPSPAGLTALAGQATRRFLEIAGLDPAAPAAYVARETHLRQLAPVRAGDALSVTTRLLGTGAGGLHLFHEVTRDGGGALASVELLLSPVDPRGGVPAAGADPAAGRLAELAAAHARLPWPEGAGRCGAAPSAGDARAGR